MHGCQIGTKCPMCKGKYDQLILLLVNKSNEDSYLTHRGGQSSFSLQKAACFTGSFMGQNCTG
jgi:hypothetical protein